MHRLHSFFNSIAILAQKKRSSKPLFYKPPSILSNVPLVTRSKKELIKPMVAYSFLGIRIAVALKV
jgi:hypothetical protein